MHFENKEEKGQLRFNEDGTISLPGSIKRDFENRKEEKILDIWQQDDQDEETHNLEDNTAGFNLYDDEKKLPALRFSNNKTQVEVVEEVVNLIKSGKKVIFIEGVCGSGKSAMALNIAKEMKGASVVVPGKALQKQYMEDYSRRKYVLKENHKKLKIKVITGRENHACKYKLGASANDSELPCKIEIKEKNFEKLQEYLKENNRVRNDLELKEIRRMSVAPVCPYWSPAVPSQMELNMEANKKRYQGLNGIEFTIHNRKPGCSYYEQFNSYNEGEVIVFNSAKYKLESLMNRKPKTNVEIIDECDEFLDSFSNVKTINLSRLSTALTSVFPEDKEMDVVLSNVINLVSGFLNNQDTKDKISSQDVFKIKDSKVMDLMDYFLENKGLLEEVDEDNYAHNLYEAALDFQEFFDETYVRFRQEERGLMLDLVSINLASRFKELLDKNEALVFMSGTLHSERVLKDIFGITDFQVVEAETRNQGEIEIVETNLEKDCSYRNFNQGNITRENYLKTLNELIARAEKPSLVHVHAFNDLPSEDEKFQYDLNNLMTKDRLKELQINDKKNELVLRFKSGKSPVLFTTKCNRGVDFPGDQCKSIVFTKFPNPNAGGIFWKILNKTYPQYYWEFYKDKARREFLQRIYRGVRSKEDHVYLLSPDKRVLDYMKVLNDKY